MPNSGKKGITVRIDANLHAQVSQYLRDHSMTMAELVSRALDDELHPKTQMKEGNTMVNTRTIAVQVPEDLFQRIKDYLQRNNVTQRQFLIVHAKLERRSQCAQNEELADAECLHLAEIVRTSVGFPELERFLAIPQLEFLGHAEHVFRCHIVTCILQVECADA